MPGADASTAVDLVTVIGEVKEALLRVQVEQEDRAARTGVAVDVTRIELTLRTLAQRSTGGEVSLRIPVLGQELAGGLEAAKQEIQTVQLTLVAPRAVPKRVAAWSLPDELARAILEIGDAIRVTAETEPPFDVDEAVVELNVTVGRGGRLSLVARGSMAREVCHTVKVHLRPRDADPAN